uniref:G patch domain-containing protein n=1 Tax=Periophthalmus magnuspinnatus TaxID=409849 RepID=A0A3B4AM82_9GOBI
NMAADSDNEKDDFVSYGTALEPLEEDEPLKKPVPIYEQTVRDEKGRYQRFHGAFTGGFSAGYFNTVGSKEGWTPSTFKSSRQSKAEQQQARPEDFMDEEVILMNASQTIIYFLSWFLTFCPINIKQYNHLLIA